MKNKRVTIVAHFGVTVYGDVHDGRTDFTLAHGAMADTAFRGFLFVRGCYIEYPDDSCMSRFGSNPNAAVSFMLLCQHPPGVLQEARIVHLLRWGES